MSKAENVARLYNWRTIFCLLHDIDPPFDDGLRKELKLLRKNKKLMKEIEKLRKRKKIKRRK